MEEEALEAICHVTVTNVFNFLNAPTLKLHNPSLPDHEGREPRRLCNNGVDE
jgi:hypothetical protein